MGMVQIGHLIILLFMVLPAALVLFSRKVAGYEKFCWSLVSLFLSWLGFLTFLIVTALRPAPSSRG
jgi:hypothetical protein